MFDFLKEKKETEKNNKSLVEVACLLIHASKIDENYTEDEKEIIKKTIINLGGESLDINEIISSAEEIEKNSNQILDFTRNIKNVDQKKSY